MASGRPRVLFLAPRHPGTPTRGDQRRVLGLIDGLARHADVSLVCFGEGGELPVDGVSVRAVGRSALGTLAANAGAAPRLPLQVRLYLDSGMRSAVAAELDRFRPDVVHATLARLGPYMPAAGPHRHMDFVDALSLNMGTRAEASRGPARAVFATEARLMRRYERGLVRAADSSSVVSETDRRAGGLDGAVVIPNGVDLEAFPFRDPAERPPVLIFFGNLGYFHNAEPARFVAEEVLPLVRREVPGTRLRLVGARPSAATRRLADLDGVELAADVPSIAAELHGAAVAVLPMFSGSGIKNKVLEAFCAGTPVVANGAGIDGVTGALAGTHYAGGEGARALAAECARLLREPGARSRLAAAGVDLVRREYTWQRQAEALLELYGL